MRIGLQAFKYGRGFISFKVNLILTGLTVIVFVVSSSTAKSTESSDIELFPKF
ncbi:unnamed protein product [Schistosoma curassoni]|uniref:Secreted protein n=1 Tax=Schistosoma curassoni TaxID=6186 RepID=A0A183K9D5_9TREM|nr:unnamed protein product [Schistosoma curassoni]